MTDERAFGVSNMSNCNVGWTRTDSGHMGIPCKEKIRKKKKKKKTTTNGNKNAPVEIYDDPAYLFFWRISV